MIDFELMQHQKDAIYRDQFQENSFLAWEPGTGKTCGTIQMLRHRFSAEGRLMRTVLICPVIVMENWKKEFGMFSKVNPKQINILLGPVAKRIARIKELTSAAIDGIVIINYDVFQDTKLLDALIAWKPEILICDEAHLVKGYKSKRAKNIASLADKCKHKYMLTGTPILNSAMDLFMPFRIMDGGKTFGSNFFVFRGTYFQDENAAWAGKPGHFPKFAPRAATYDMLSKILETKMSVVKKSDCLDLPPYVVEERIVEMSDDQKRIYAELKRDFIAFIESKKGEPRAVVAKLAVTKALRLQQVVTGYAKDDTGEVHHFVDCPRVEALRALLEEVAKDHKVIVWACFIENYKQIREVCDALGIRYTELHGGIGNQDKFRNVEEFNTDPGCRVLIGHPQAGGVGINLVGASYSINYSRDFKLGNALQSEARNYRRGSEIHNKITRIDLVSPNTIDELISSSLKDKQDISDRILDLASKI